MKFLPLSALFALLCLPAAAQETRLTLHISFDTASTTALQERGEMVVVSVVYTGEPAIGNVLPLDEMGMLFLGKEEFILWPLDTTVHLGGSLGGAPVVVPKDTNMPRGERQLMVVSKVDLPTES